MKRLLTHVEVLFAYGRREVMPMQVYAALPEPTVRMTRARCITRTEVIKRRHEVTRS